MTYEATLLPAALADLRRLDRTVARRILAKIAWLAENVDDLTPEALSADLRGLFKLRVGSYRVIYSVDRQERTVVIHLIGHRRDIYRTR